MENQMKKLSFIEFEAVLTQWKEAVASEHNISEMGIETEEFLETFYTVIETFAKLCFEDNIDDIYDYVYDMSELTIKELYDLVYE